MLPNLALEDVPWSSVHIIRVDERIAPPGDPDRNLMHLRESLLSRVPLRPEQIHAMPVDCADLESACSRYSQTLEEMAGAPPMKTFRALSPLKELQRRFGFEPDNVVQAVKQQLCQSR